MLTSSLRSLWRHNRDTPAARRTVDAVGTRVRRGDPQPITPHRVGVAASASGAGAASLTAAPVTVEVQTVGGTGAATLTVASAAVTPDGHGQGDPPRLDPAELGWLAAGHSPEVEEAELVLLLAAIS